MRNLLIWCINENGNNEDGFAALHSDTSLSDFVKEDVFYRSRLEKTVLDNNYGSTLYEYKQEEPKLFYGFANRRQF